MPNFLITEYFVPFEEIGLTISDNPLIPVEGYITLDNKPGLGMNLIEENFDKFPYKEFLESCLKEIMKDFMVVLGPITQVKIRLRLTLQALLSLKKYLLSIYSYSKKFGFMF